MTALLVFVDQCLERSFGLRRSHLPQEPWNIDVTEGLLIPPPFLLEVQVLVEQVTGRCKYRELLEPRRVDVLHAPHYGIGLVEPARLHASDVINVNHWLLSPLSIIYARV